MKKRKFSLLLNVATICLCVCAIAIGVYSAKTASLSISGSIGFNAHNIDYSATVTMYGHSGEDGKPVAESSAVSLSETSGTCAIPTGTTFSDLGTSGNPETIYIKVEVTNKSDYPIAVKVDLAKCTSGNSSLTIGASQNTSAVILADKNATETETIKKTGSVIFELNLQPNSSGDYDDINPATAVSLKVGLAKTDLDVTDSVRADVAIKEFTSTEISTKRQEVINVTPSSGSPFASDVQSMLAQTGSTYAEVYPYYVEMGEYTNSSSTTEKVKWLIVGTMGDSGLVALSDKDRTALSEGLMLNNTYSMLSEKILYSESTSNYGISFQNKYTNSSSDDYPNDYGYKANDYATSNIRQYLLGVTVSRTATLSSGVYNPTEITDEKPGVNLYTTYNLTTDPVFNKIKGRSLSSLYNESKVTGSLNSGDTADMLIVPTSKDSSGYTAVDFTGATEDKLWLLSQTEMTTIFKMSTGSDFDIGTQMLTTVLGTASSGYWWLRSPGSSAVSARYVDDYGYLDYGHVGYYDGARVAFQI